MKPLGVDTFGKIEKGNFEFARWSLKNRLGRVLLGYRRGDFDLLELTGIGVTQNLVGSG